MSRRQAAQRLGLGVLVLVNLAGAGGAVAAAAIGSTQIVDGGVRSRDVKDGTLRPRDLAPSTVAALRGESGPRGARGEQGAQGEKGEPGGSGPTSVAQTVAFYGPVASIPGSSGLWVFAGPPGQVTTTAVHPRVTAAASAALGFVTGTPEGIADLGMCFRPSSGGAVSNFYGGNFSQYGFSGARLPYTATATVLLPPGSWLVGLCVRNAGNPAISNNNYVNGYAQVTQ